MADPTTITEPAEGTFDQPPDAPPSPSYEQPPEASPKDPGSDGDEDASPDASRSDVEQPRDGVVEDIVPYAESIDRVLVDVKGRSLVFVQKTLTYFDKIELYGLLGRAVQLLMDGENGLGLDDVMDLADPRKMVDRMISQIPGADESPDRADQQNSIDEAAKMMSIFAKVISASPDMLREAYCIILHIPIGQRKWAVDWALPEIDDETGDDIMNAFIDQNWGVLEDFFTKQLPKLFRRAAKARELHRSATDRSRR